VQLWYFEVLDMFRRFTVLGLPKILRALAPNAGIEIYLGLLIMAVSPVIYSQMDPYDDRNDHNLMIFTQLAQTVVVLCGMVRENVKGNLANWVVTVVIMGTLCPMFLVLISFVWDPTGRVAYRLFVPNTIDQKWDEVKVLLRKLAGKSKEARKAIEVAIASVEEGDTEDAEAIFQLCGKIGLSVIDVDEAALRENLSQLLGAFGVSAKQADMLLDSAGLGLMIWCLQPVLEPAIAKHGFTWEDVLPVLETVDSIDELKAAVKEPVAFLERIAEGSHLIAKKLAIMHLKPPLELHLAKHGLEWADVVPVLEEVDSVEELKGAVADIGNFLEKLANTSGPAAKKLAIMHLKPPLALHLAKHGLEWADVVPVLEEVDSIEELKAAIESPMAFLNYASKAGAEGIGIAISASLHVLEVVPGGQGAQNGVLVGDVISSVGSSEVSCDDSMQKSAAMHIKAAALLSEARARGEQVITILFNSGAKSADFEIESRLITDAAQYTSHTLQCKQTKVKSPAEGNSAPPLHGAASSVGVLLANAHCQEDIESVARRPSFGCYSEEVSQLPSPAERMRRVIAQGMSVEEQREQERQNARIEAATYAEAAAAAAIPTEDLEAALMQAKTILMECSDV
jgi:hypothetical protein